MAQLAAAGIDPVAIYPDISLMPENPAQTVLWLERSRLAVRRPGTLPFAVELTPVAEALVVAGVIPDPLAEPPRQEAARGLGKRGAVRDAARTGRGCRRVPGASADKFASLKVQVLARGPLPWLAQRLQSPEAVNLLQGEFARSTDYSARWQRWRTAALLAGGLLVAHMAAAAIRIHQANHETKALDTQISQIFAAGHAVREDAGPAPPDAVASRPDPAFGRGARILSARPGGAERRHVGGAKTRIDSLAYREQALDLRVTAPSLAALSQLSQLVSKQGLTADIQSSSPSRAASMRTCRCARRARKDDR